ncbi:hypothetical protein EHS25_006718 [Saitozyma podzolica]|uniref:Uncharacterized protein n=1 Tax=Saitozyma podzolica TaxID=1890683 RepID=A0A427YSF0_9TREE|nr:hypothetical protein EHS25_006718 [Saitozyma podzolica]
MSALRPTLRRFPLRAARPLSTLSAARPLAPLATKPLFASPPALPQNFKGLRFVSNSTPVALEASSVVGDGGMHEPPDCGINVDKPIRMDTFLRDALGQIKN